MQKESFQWLLITHLIQTEGEHLMKILTHLILLTLGLTSATTAKEVVQPKNIRLRLKLHEASFNDEDFNSKPPMLEMLIEHTKGSELGLKFSRDALGALGQVDLVEELGRDLEAQLTLNIEPAGENYEIADYVNLRRARIIRMVIEIPNYPYPIVLSQQNCSPRTCRLSVVSWAAGLTYTSGPIDFKRSIQILNRYGKVLYNHPIRLHTGH